MQGRYTGMAYPKRLFYLFATTIVTLVGSLLVLFWIGVLTINELRVVQHDEGVINLLRLTQAKLTDAETGERGYLLAGDAEYLRPYEEALGQIGKLRSDLKKTGIAEELGPAEESKLDQLIALKLDELRHTIEIRREQGLEAVLPIVKSDGGKRTMDAIRDQITSLIRVERGKMDSAAAAVMRSISFRARIFLVILILNPSILIWAYLRIKKEALARQRAALDVQQQKDLLSVTLGSIGDAVMVTDPQGRVTYMNAVAESLTGWSVAAAQGQQCSTVFHIINEETRQAVESPVEKVLSQGAIVGLANHTILLQRDGTEVPIDDSGAPIRDAQGLVRGVVLIFRDFSERKEAERKLLAAKLEVETSSRAKDQFLASLSHELRTPLTPVLATLTAWEILGQIPEALRGDVELLRRNIELEARLIDDLLDLTRIAKGKMRLSREVADVHALLRAAEGVCESDITQKRIHVTMALNATERYAQVDSARLQQVFWNVLKNATKFTPENGTITAKSANIDGHLQVTISDTGIGMSEETTQRLFLPFEQGADDITRRFGGLGLGMAISKAIIDQLGGTITAQSAGEGHGSTITITLPTVAAPPAKSPLPTASGPARKLDDRQLKILLVEDHQDTAAVIKRLLSGLGHEVHVSESVAASIDAANLGPFDLLLSDIGLPDGSGMDVLREVRRSSQMPAIAMTGYGMEEDVAQCREAGFNGHLTKPVSFQQLQSLISEVVKA